MAKTGKKVLQIDGPAGKLPVQNDDKFTRQLAMLFEGKCLGIGPIKAAWLYNFKVDFRLK